MKQQGMTKLSTGMVVVRESKNGVLKITAYTPQEWEFKQLQWWQKAKRLINTIIRK